ncbi:alpha-E domain-containing protein [Methyloversatilis universalis]|uniref:alpha-E domain-containing protein n=1 Tax=Methyloversatilis universalis TaxID=378211 RepID=UPI00037B15EF|nr:alpha-E domain-containing protein [Methyloversatilis universalis]
MLSRTADHLYWMARYIERAENIARMLDVNYRMSMVPEGDAGWGATLSINGLEQAFRAKHDEATAEAVLDFMVFDGDNPSSILSCLRMARENAHAVRGTITSEMWETTNDTWLRMRDYPRWKLVGSEIGEFFEWVKFRSHLSRGVTLGTMLRDEAFHFIRLGTFLERADATARFIDVKYHMLVDGKVPPDAAADYYQWSALLRSVSAFEVYRKVYRDLITPVKVTELLILNEQMPRSLRTSMVEVYENLQAVSNYRSKETQRRAGELQASLKFGRIEDVFARGLHEYLTQFIVRVNELGNRISNDFLVPMSAS